MTNFLDCKVDSFLASWLHHSDSVSHLFIKDGRMSDSVDCSPHRFLTSWPSSHVAIVFSNYLSRMQRCLTLFIQALFTSWHRGSIAARVYPERWLILIIYALNMAATTIMCSSLISSQLPSQRLFSVKVLQSISVCLDEKRTHGIDLQLSLRLAV